MDAAPETSNTLEEAIISAHYDLLNALDLEPLGDDRFRAPSERGRFDRIFGGQLLAQALVAAAKTVAEQKPNSLHAYFTGAGMSERPVDLVVERIRDGRSLAIRRVEITQNGQTLLTAIGSFHTNASTPELTVAPPSVPAPEQMPSLQEWVSRAPADLKDSARLWTDRPPPLELRIDEPPYFMGGPAATGTRSHWMRLPDAVEDATMQAALLTYASDYFLLDMAFRSVPGAAGAAEFTGLSLDHTIWIHRPVDFRRWHLHSQETLALAGDRGLVRGSIHDDSGRLVATVAQAVLVWSKR